MELIDKKTNLDPEQLVTDYCKRLKCAERAAIVAIKLIQAAKTKNLTSGKSPKGVAAAAIYIVNKVNDVSLTQKEVSQACGVTEVTVRNRTNELTKAFNIAI
jgi:transcription initiation factor TFIIB